MKKKVFAMFLLAAMLLSQVVVAFAAVPDIGASSSDIELFYIPCPQGGKHHMRTVGNAMVYESYPGPIAFVGSYAECSKCRFPMAVENWPMGQDFRYIGRYHIGTWQMIDGLYLLVGVHGEYWNLQEDAFISGFEWYHR